MLHVKCEYEGKTSILHDCDYRMICDSIAFKRNNVNAKHVTKGIAFLSIKCCNVKSFTFFVHFLNIFAILIHKRFNVK